MEQKKKNINPFNEELLKFIGKEVVVSDINDKKFKGICRAISLNHLNVIVMTDKFKIAVKNISSIVRERSYKK